MSDRHLINALHTQETWHLTNRYGGFQPIYFKMLEAARQRGLRG